MSLCVCFGRESPKDPREDVPRVRNGSGNNKHVVVPEEVPETNELFKGISDGAIWNCPIGKHQQGDFSFAVVQANTMMEDYSHLESTSSGTFVGIYDGHGGDRASSFLSENMHQIVQSVAELNGGLNGDVFRQAFEAADSQLLDVVRDNWKIKPAYATSGSCALVSVVEGSTLYIASVGDSRAVLGTAEMRDPDSSFSRRHRLTAVQLSLEHNASKEDVRKEVQLRCPDDPSILQEKGGMWRVKGIIQVTRSIGDFYLKSQEFQCPPLYTKYRLPEELKTPALICSPAVTTRALTHHDKFLILATDGLWENVSNQEAVDIVQRSPRKGIARRLVKLSMIRAASRRKLTFENIQLMRPGRRREVHDDISVVVLFFDHVAAPRTRQLNPVAVTSFQELALAAEDGPVSGTPEEDVPNNFEFNSSFQWEHFVC